MKEHRALTPRQEALAERALFGAILTLRSVDECRAFFRDLCTPAELQALADRWAVVALLQQGVPYREIHKQTGVSVTTIGRVARYLLNGNGGYTLAAERMKDSTDFDRARPTMMDKASRLKVALQKSGRLTDNSLDLMVRCGLKYSRGKDQLMCYGENMPLDLLFVRDDDIPDLVQQDVCDLGIVGLNVIEEKRLAFQARGVQPLFEQLMTLDYGKCRLSIAVPDGVEYKDARSMHGKRIATTYPNILARYLRQHDVQAEIVTLSGAVEIAPRLGRADFICDLVSTGSTLIANHLWEAETILESQAAIITHAGAGVRREAGLDPSPVDAHRRRAAGEGKQIHHAARAALQACGHSQAPARQRVAHHRAARRHRRQSRRACGMSRKRVLGNPREPQEPPAPVRSWCCRSRRCSLEIEVQVA